jgi:hypothetical protein
MGVFGKGGPPSNLEEEPPVRALTATTRKPAQRLSFWKIPPPAAKKEASSFESAGDIGSRKDILACGSAVDGWNGVWSGQVGREKESDLQLQRLGGSERDWSW